MRYLLIPLEKVKTHLDVDEKKQLTKLLEQLSRTKCTSLKEVKKLGKYWYLNEY